MRYYTIRRVRQVDLGAEAIFIYWCVYTPNYTTIRFHTWREAIDYAVQWGR